MTDLTDETATDDDNDALVDGFIAKRAEIELLLTRMLDSSNRHFGIRPDRINEAHIIRLMQAKDHLRTAFKAGASSGSNPKGGEHRGLLYGADSLELPPWLQPSLDAR